MARKCKVMKRTSLQGWRLSSWHITAYESNVYKKKTQWFMQISWVFQNIFVLRKWIHSNSRSLYFPISPNINKCSWQILYTCTIFYLIETESNIPRSFHFRAKSHSILTVEFTAFSKSMRNASSRPAFLIDRTGICVARQPAPRHPLEHPPPRCLCFPAANTETTVLTVPTGQVFNTW